MLNPSQHLPPSQGLTQEQLIEYISKAIKNNKKHFEKDHDNEELYNNLKVCKSLASLAPPIFSLLELLGVSEGSGSPLSV